MTDRATLYQGVSCAAWGYFFLWFNINIGNICILPSFIGCLLFLSAIRHLSGERRDLVLLRPLCLLLTVWYGVDWLASWAGLTVDGLFLPLDLVISAVSLYFHFQLLTDLAGLAAAYQQTDPQTPPQANQQTISQTDQQTAQQTTRPLDRRLLRWRTVQVLLLTANSLAVYLPEGTLQAFIALSLSLIGCLVCICLMFTVFALRKLFRDNAPVVS